MLYIIVVNVLLTYRDSHAGTFPQASAAIALRRYMAIQRGRSPLGNPHQYSCVQGSLQYTCHARLTLFYYTASYLFDNYSVEVIIESSVSARDSALLQREER